MTASLLTRTAGDLFADRYELLAELGSGAFGDVWKAKDTHRGHVIALKILEGGDEDAAWHEATRLTELESPHILRVNNAALAIDVPYIDTVLAEKGTANDILRPYGVNPSDAIRLSRAVLSGLQLCHQRRLLHRDIKPSNIFLTGTGDAQLGDFGVAATMDSSNTASPNGDPDIRAPEVLKGGRCTAATDVYSAGLSLYAMVTGGLPFSLTAAGDFRTHREAVIRGPRDIRDVAPHVGTSLARVVRRAIAARPQDRYPSAAAFDSALAGLPAVRADICCVQPHPGHERCWSCTRRSDGHQVLVCVTTVGGSKYEIVVTHADSGRRLSALCARLSGTQSLLVQLRSAFNTLRS